MEDDTTQKSHRLKLYPWRDWQEWTYVYRLLFSNISSMAMPSNSISGDKEINLLSIPDNVRKALDVINAWLLRNVGGDQSKYLKMQKLLLVQTLSLIRSI